MIMRAAERLAFIDGWRAVAILLVFADHLGMNKEIGAFYEQSAIGVVSQYGETGVFIFFFISGFRNGPIGVKSLVSNSPIFGAARACPSMRPSERGDCDPIPSSSSPVSCFRPWSTRRSPHDAFRGNGEPI
jgi:hypothetical protein